MLICCELEAAAEDDCDEIPAGSPWLHSETSLTTLYRFEPALERFPTPDHILKRVWSGASPHTVWKSAMTSCISFMGHREHGAVAADLTVPGNAQALGGVVLCDMTVVPLLPAWEHRRITPVSRLPGAS